MNFRNRTNKVQAPIKMILTGNGDQNVLATGAYPTTGNTVNIGDQQLGVLSADNSSATQPFNDYLAAGNTAVQVKSIRLVQGTPYSSNLSLISPFNVTHKASLMSDYIDADKVISVTTKQYAPASYATQHLTAITAPTVSTNYKLTLTLQSQKRDIEYSDRKRDQIVSVKQAPAGTVDTTSYILENLAWELNNESLYVTGTKPFIVFGIDAAGGGGTTIGTLAAGDSIPFQLVNGQTYSITADTTLINTLVNAVATTAALATATIEVLDPPNAGGAAGVDQLLVMGFNEPDAIVFDDSISKKVRAEMHTDLDGTLTTTSRPTDEVGIGSTWKIEWLKRVAPYIYSLQNKEFGNYDVLTENIPRYMVDTQGYVSTIIEYFSQENNASGRLSNTMKQAVILLRSGITNPTANVNTGYTVATTDSTTVTDLNNILGAWLSSASNEFSNIQYLEGATQAAPFV